VRAARQAIERAEILKIDLTRLCGSDAGSNCSDRLSDPSEIGANNAAAFDPVVACSGFVYGVTPANQMIQPSSALRPVTEWKF